MGTENLQETSPFSDENSGKSPGETDMLPQSDAQQEVGWGIDKGQVRDTNEDSLAAVTLNQASDDGQQSIGVYAIADGMGGHHGGEVASKIAVRTVIRKILEDVTQADDSVPAHYHDWLDSAVKLANDIIRNRAQEDEVHKGMGTTLVVAMVVGQKVHIVNIGDSRAYAISAQGIRQITHDHSFVQALLDNGAISKEDAANHPYRNILLQALGTKETVKSDMFHETLGEGESLLLCSDGLWEMLSETEIARIVHEAKTPDEACQNLIDAANKAGGHDNIAAVVVRLGTNDTSTNPGNTAASTTAQV
jgi:PPM family protein phosphatase